MMGRCVSGEGALVTLEGKGFGDIVVSVSKICEWVLERAQTEVITAERVARPSLGVVRAGMPQARRHRGASLPQQRAFDNASGSVQFSRSVMSNSVTPWIAARQASLSITNSQSSPKLLSIELVMPSSHLILCCPLLFLPPIPPSNKVFSNESTLCMRWPKYWSFSFSISPFKEHPGLISFRMDWLDLLAIQGTLKSLLQHHSSKASILLLSAVFTVQLSHPYDHWKNHSLD